jgi:hypothetical protein
VRLVGRSRAPVFALLLLAPSIPELLTGSTPITRLVTDPLGFAVGFGLDIGLYGTGALLIREFCVAYRRGWASILLLGAAYGIAEEGFAVHTFFERSGSPVGTFGSYGHAWGVNWLWALGLTIFHATYSIALPILLTYLWYPESKGERWLDRGLVGLVAVVYLADVLLLGLAFGHGPSPAAFAFFLGVVAVLLYLAARVPRDLLAVRTGPSRIGRLGLAVVGSFGFDAWLGALLLSKIPGFPAWAAASVLVAVDLAALAVILTQVGRDDLERSALSFAIGMFAILFLFDVLVEFSVPGILVVSAVFAYLLYRLDRKVTARTATRADTPPPGGPPPGALLSAVR